MNHHKQLLSLVALLSIVMLAGCKDDNRFKSGDGNIPSGCDVLGADLAKGLDITDVSIFQGVRIPLMEDGQAVTGEEATLVAGKDAMMRVHVVRQTEYTSRDVYVRVEFSGGSGDLCPVEEMFNVSANSDIAILSSTLNVDIPGDAVQPGISYAVSVREVSEDVSASGNSQKARWPVDGTDPLDAKDAGGPLKIVIVPIRYNADGSGRLPELGDMQLGYYEDTFYNTYPVPEVEIEVLEPVDWNSNVSAYGTGWDTLLNQVTQFRGQNGAADNEYYFGSFAPASSFGAYCSSGCVAGLCNLVESPSMSWGRSCIGLGFPGVEAAWTMVHEVGHAHGRYHSPSGGAQQVDPNYPYPGGVIGVYGYNLFDEILFDPNQTFDFMGYSMQTNWVSDYTYDALFDRVVAVNAMADMILPPDFNEWWPTIAIGIDGTVSKGPDLRLDAPPAVLDHEVRFLDANGQELGSANGYFMAYDHLPGGLVIYPEASPDVNAVQLPGYAPVQI